VTEIVVPPDSAGPPLHTHDFDEAFYMLEGEMIFQVEDALVTKGAGELSFAPRNVAHTLANHSDAPARYRSRRRHDAATAKATAKTSDDSSGSAI
jgi:quercetin dioxygenase-like cupin family protein